MREEYCTGQKAHYPIKYKFEHEVADQEVNNDIALNTLKIFNPIKRLR